MGDFQYSFQNFDRSKHVRAALREKSISHKHAREVAIALKGMSIERARVFLEDVIARKIAVPYRR
jgi:large subunit ribosomal protein L22